jgi:acyl phosphate:glycerol-3-phosphate acyltransferase
MPDLLGDAFYQWPYYAGFALAYLLGSIPFGLLLTRLVGLGDIRKIGSGNIGATNVLRTGFAAVGVVLGHCFPVWLKFKGGKGVATTLGVLLALDFPVGAIACLAWLAAAILFRMSSLAALLAMAGTPIAAHFLSMPQIRDAAALIAVLVILRHWANIKRIARGEEPKIGNKER